MNRSSLKFVSESVIDETFQQLELDTDYMSQIQQLGKQQPTILAYLTSDSFRFFSDEERSYLLFLVLVIYHSLEKVNAPLPIINQEQIGLIEEKNWDVFQAAKSRVFREKLDVFFKNYPQEDLLAFVEDALEMDENNIISDDGRAYIFISLKTIIDAFIDAN